MRVVEVPSSGDPDHMSLPHQLSCVKGQRTCLDRALRRRGCLRQFAYPARSKTRVPARENAAPISLASIEWRRAAVQLVGTSPTAIPLRTAQSAACVRDCKPNLASMLLV